ncbi:hypothetical protein Tco_0408137 [Tanacetum coccineum]
MYSGPRDTQYCMGNPKQAFVDYASPRNNGVGEKGSGGAETSKIEEKEESSVIGKDDKSSDIENKTYEDKTNIGEEDEWIEYEQPLDLIDVHDESVYEALIKKMPSCSLNFNFRIEKGNPNNLKIPCMIRRKFIANAYIDLDLPMNVMFITYYNAIMIQGYEHRGLNYVRIGMDMHVFVGNMSYVMDINIL